MNSSNVREALHGHVIKGKLFRQRGAMVPFTKKPPVQRTVVRRPAKVARLLSLAHHLQRAIDSGVLVDRADIARKLGVTRARITQLLDLLLLAPDIQESILALEAVDGVEPLAERVLRELVSVLDWGEQRRVWRERGNHGASHPVPATHWRQ